MNILIPIKRILPILLVSTLFLTSCRNNSKTTAQVKGTNEIAPITPKTALESYLKKEDDSYAWELKEKYKLENVTVYDVLLTSQKWREHTWKHKLTILVPKEVAHEG